MSNKILVTDSLFISEEHVRRLVDEGYEVERLDKTNATEDELIEHLKGKVAYILGGMEMVTDKVLESTEELKVIAFTGTDWTNLIPGWQTATLRGIAVSDSPGANSIAVAEFAMAVALAMQRNLFEIGRTGESTKTTGSLKDANIGIIGAGAIGQKIISQAKAFGPREITYYSRTQKDVGAEYSKLNDLIQNSDIIFLAAPGSAGQIFDSVSVSAIKQNALLVSISPMNLIDFDALYTRLEAGTLRAAIDWEAPDKKFDNLPLSVWFNTNAHSAYNTDQALKQCSDMAVDSLLNLLKTGNDQYLANPEYRDNL